MIKPAFVGPERLGMPAPETWTPAQRSVVDAMTAGPRKGIVGPFKPLLHSPELADCVQRTGAYLRFNTGIAPSLTELAILIVAAHWGQPVEWAIHRPIALAAGVSAEVVHALETGTKPPLADGRQEILYCLITETLKTRAVSDAVYNDALAAFGEKGVIDLVALCGYYSQLAMVMNVARTRE